MCMYIKNLKQAPRMRQNEMEWLRSWDGQDETTRVAVMSPVREKYDWDKIDRDEYGWDKIDRMTKMIIVGTVVAEIKLIEMDVTLGS